MVRDYKKDILSVDTFLDNRPDMSVHSEQSIQSAIYSAASLLNGETNGNIEVVWTYNKSEERNQNDPRYRNDYELGQIVEAFIVQTQYTLNIGNDFSVGGGSYSIGNINSSFSRPLDRDIIAPGVVRLLQNARVYQAQSYFSSGEQKDCGSCVDYDADCITRNIGDMRYVRKEQQANLRGYIATIDDNGFVMFAKPSYIGIPENVQSQIDSLKLGVSTNKQNIETNKQAIDETKLAMGMISLAVNNNIDRLDKLEPKVEKNTGDITQIRNQHAQDTTSINNRFGNVEGKVELIEEALRNGKILHFETEQVEWQANHSYSIGALATDGGKTYYSKVNQNLNHKPSTSPDYWQLFSDTTIDLSNYPTKSEVLKMLDDYLKLSDFETRIANYYTKDETNDLLDTKANTSDLDEYTLHEEFLKSQKQQDDNIKRVEAKVDAIETGKVEGVKVATFTLNAPINDKESIGWSQNELDNRYTTLSTNQTITGSKAFDSDTVWLNKHRLRLRKDNTTNVLDIFPGSTNDNGYIEAKTGDLVLSGNTINVNNKRVVNVATPTSNNDAANKAYVDSKTPDLSKYAREDDQNRFTSSNYFQSGLYVIGSIYFRSKDEMGTTLSITTPQETTGVTTIKQYDASGSISRDYTLNYKGPQSVTDLVDKQYVDNKSPKRKSFRLNQFTKFYDGGFDKHSNWWGGIWRIPSSTLALPSNTRIVSVTFDMSVDYSQPWYRQTMFNWWWDVAGYLVVRVIKIYDSNSDFTYWSDNVTVNIEYCGN